MNPDDIGDDGLDLFHVYEVAATAAVVRGQIGFGMYEGMSLIFWAPEPFPAAI